MTRRQNQERSPDARRDAAVRLQAIPNVGPAVAGDLIRLGITRLEDAAGRDPDAMYRELCALDGVRHDPCLRDVFTAVVAHADGEEARPWWTFTPARKDRDTQSAASRSAAVAQKSGRVR